jgi:hypothetical protein
MENIEYDSIYDQIVDQIKSIDSTNLSDEVDQNPSTTEIEKQKVYIWIRLYLKSEVEDLQEGDDFLINWSLSGETLSTKFICFGKKHSFKDSDGENEISMATDDDPLCLCLMVDEEIIKKSEDIPFIRSLFKISDHYQEQVYHRDELTFTNTRTSQKVEYTFCDF